MDQCFYVIFFYYFHTVYKRSSKNKSCENTAAGKFKKKTYSQRCYTSVSEISDQTQWSMCFHNNLKSGFREMSTSSSSYLMICVSSVARNNQLSDCFICTKQYIYVLQLFQGSMYSKNLLKAHLCTTLNKVSRNQKVEITNNEFPSELDRTKIHKTGLGPK